MARNIKEIEIQGQPAVALFDSGAVFTYVRTALAATAPTKPIVEPFRVALGRPMAADWTPSSAHVSWSSGKSDWIHGGTVDLEGLGRREFIGF